MPINVFTELVTNYNDCGIYISDVGMSLILVSRISLVNIYFDKNKGKANSIIFVMGAVGALYMAPLSTFLYEEYMFSGTMLIFGAMALHALPAAMLFRPLVTANMSKVFKNEVSLLELEQNPEERDKLMYKRNILTSPSEKDNEPLSSTDVPEGKVDKTEDTLDTNHKYEETDPSRVLQDLPDDSSSAVKKRTAKKRLMRATGCDVLTDPLLVALGIFLTSVNYTLGTSGTVIAGLCMQKGYSIGEVTLMLTVSSAIEIMSRGVSGPLFDCKYTRPKRPLLLGAMGIGVGATSIVLPLAVGIPFTMATFFLFQVRSVSTILLNIMTLILLSLLSNF